MESGIGGRLMSKVAAAEYLGITVPTLAKMIADGLLPPPIPGTTKMDRKAIDHALDRASGLSCEKDDSDD